MGFRPKSQKGSEEWKIRPIASSHESINFSSSATPLSLVLSPHWNRPKLNPGISQSGLQSTSLLMEGLRSVWRGTLGRSDCIWRLLIQSACISAYLCSTNQSIVNNIVNKKAERFVDGREFVFSKVFHSSAVDLMNNWRSANYTSVPRDFDGRGSATHEWRWLQWVFNIFQWSLSEIFFKRFEKNCEQGKCTQPSARLPSSPSVNSLESYRISSNQFSRKSFLSHFACAASSTAVDNVIIVVILDGSAIR